MTELLIDTHVASGHGQMCRVIWSEDDGTHIVAQTPDGRTIIAKRSMGAWIEISLQTVAARLNRT